MRSILVGLLNAVVIVSGIFSIPYVAAASMGQPALPFIENRGQADPSVRYYAATFAGTVYVTVDGELRYALDGPVEVISEAIAGGRIGEITGCDQIPTRISYFKGKESAGWKTDIPAFRSIDFGEVYPGIRLTLVAQGRNVEKVFCVRPGGDPRDIRLQIDGARRLGVLESGELELLTGQGYMRFSRPLAYQVIDGLRQEVQVAYSTDGLSYGFDLGKYNPDYPVTIDPLLASTYLGDSGDDGSTYLNTHIAVDADGYVYVTGGTTSANFPVQTGGYEMNFQGGEDVYVAKFDADLTDLIACTFIGGYNDEEAGGIAIAEDGSIYIGGNTLSSDFPTIATCLDTSYNGTSASAPYEAGGDVFICRLNADLSELLAGTYLGGSSHDYCRGIVLDDIGQVYVTGATASTNFPVSPTAFDPTHNPGGYYADDAYVSKLDSDLETLLGSTYVGGNDFDYAEELVLGDDGSVFFCGWTAASNYPWTSAAFDTTYNGHYYDGFVSRLNNELSEMIASTFLGGSSWDFCYAMCRDSEGNIYTSGHTASNNNFPLTDDAFDTTYGGVGNYSVDDDAFVTKFSPDLDQVLASSFLGGDLWEIGCAMQCGGDGFIYLTGFTDSYNFTVTPGAYDEYPNGAEDAFVVRISPDLTSLCQSTYFGSNGDDAGYGLTVNQSGAVYISGRTTSMTNFPLSDDAYQPAYGGGAADAFAAKLDSLLSTNISGIEQNPARTSMTDGYRLNTNYPNPFNNETMIRYQLPTAGPVAVEVVDVRGNRIRTLVDSWLPQGEYSAHFTADDLSSGVYFVRLSAGDLTISRRLVLVR